MSTLKVDTVDTRTGSGNITFSRPTVLQAGDIVTADLADDAVTLAKMAGGTDGQIITFDASGDPVAVGPGTDGQVLTSTGAGSPPAFEAAGGGAWTLIGSQVATDDADLSQTGLDSTYDTYAIVLSDILTATDAQHLYLRLGDSGGYDSGSTDYFWHLQVGVSGAGYGTNPYDNSADPEIRIGSNLGNASGEGMGAFF
jgi:hypothetical protein